VVDRRACGELSKTGGRRRRLSEPKEADFVADLWSGLFDPTSSSFAGAVLLCVLEIVGCSIAFQPRTLARINPQLLIENPGDEYPVITLRLLALRFGFGQPGLHVAYVGASQATRALADRDPAALSEKITAAAGQRVTFDPLSADGQRFEEALVITDQLPPSFRGVVTMFVNDYKNDYAPRDRERRAHTQGRIAVVDAPSMAKIWAEEKYAPPKTGIFFYDHLDFFAPRRFAALRLSPADFWPRREKPARVATEKFEAAVRSMRRVARRVESDDPTATAFTEGEAELFAKSRSVLDKLVANMRGRGLPLVFVQSPESPVRLEVCGPRIARFEEQMSEYAKESGSEYWILDRDLDLEAEDFQDVVHLGNEEARERFERAFMRKLGDFIRTHYPPR
jgi:hypothetical protein